MSSISLRVRQAGARPVAAAAAAAARGRRLRRLLIVLAMLVEAGLPFFPRVPLTGVLFILSAIALIAAGGLNRRALPLVAIPVVVMIVMALLQSGTSAQQIVSRFVNFCSAIFLVSLYLQGPRSQLADDMRPILRLMALQGIATILLANAVPGLFSTMIYGDTDYKTIGLLFTYHMTAVDSFAKADGFFFERGVFQLFLNLFLYFSLFVYRSKADSLLAILSVLSTWSTSGAVIMVMLFVGSALIGPKRAAGASRAGSVLLMGVLIAALGPLAYYNVQDKLAGSQASSADARRFDLVAGLQIVEENAITGIGFSNEEFTDAFRTKAALSPAGDLLVERGMSNGIMRLFIAIGVPLGLLFLVGLFNSRIVPNPVIVGLVLFTALLSEPIVFCPFILLVIFSGLVPERRAVAQPIARRHGNWIPPAGHPRPAMERFLR